MKKFLKIGCGSLVAIFVLLVVIGMIAGGGEETATPTPATSAPAEESKTEEAPAAKEEPVEKEVKVPGIGEVVTVGDAEFTLNSVDLADQVGPSALPTTASGKYVVLNVTYKNNGNEAVTIDSNFFKLVRGEKTYESDSMASMSANQANDGTIQNSFFLQEVNPDMAITGNVAFDLAPEVAESTDLQLQVQSGFWGTETGIINLK